MICLGEKCLEKGNDYVEKNIRQVYLECAEKSHNFILTSLLTQLEESIQAQLEEHHHNSIPCYFDGLEDGCGTCIRNKGIKDSVSLIQQYKQQIK